MSQGAFGAAWAQAPAQRGRIAAAAALGGISGLAADLDGLIRSSTDPLLLLEMHRQFSHALIFIPVGALGCALVLHWFVRRRQSFGRSYAFCFLGYASHGVLDACTTYGTHLFWPFSDTRVAWNFISVFDPLFTLPVLVLVALAARRGRRRLAHVALAWAVVYMTFGFVQHERALASGRQIAADRGHEPVRLEAKPAFASLLLWKTIYEHDGRYYVDAVRAGIDTAVWPGDSVEKLDIDTHLPWLDPDSQQARDVERFRRISDGFVAPGDEPGHVVDMRYSMVPNEIDPFWAIVLDPEAPPGQHARFVTTRENAPEQTLRLLDMMSSLPDAGADAGPAREERDGDASDPAR